MVSFSVPVCAGSFVAIAMLIIAGDLPSTNAAPLHQDQELIYLGSVDGSSFYAGTILNVTRGEAQGFCGTHNLRLPSFEMESHRQFFDQLISSNVIVSDDAADSERLRLFWLSNESWVNTCEAAFIVRDGTGIHFQTIWDDCSGLAAVVVCEGDE